MATDITVTEDVTTVTVTESTTAIDISPQVTSVGVSAVDITAANIASSISLTPTGNISATNVQAGFNELASEVAFLSGADFTGDVTISNGELTVNGKVEAELFQGDIDGAIHFKGAVASGATLTKGDVVYISGHSGQKTEVDKADASDSNKMPAFGIVAADPVGQNVDVVTFGTLKTINTSAYSEGDELFVSTTAGQLTSTAPSGEGNLVQKIAKVVRANVSGNIKIMGAGRTNATPNLNDGNIFIGDSNNQATTASFAAQVASADITESQITDLQSYLTDYTVTEADVRAHEAAIQITESQITNLQSYLTSETSHDDVLVDGDFTSSGYMKTDGNGNYSVESGSIAEVNDLTTSVTWANVPDANITESSVTQHQAAISITESQITDLQSYLTAETSHADVVVDGDFTSAGFMKRGASAGTYEIASTISFTDLDCVKDEDDMTSDSATHVPTQQSVKAFVEDRELKFFYENKTVSQSLSTSSATIWQSFDTPTYSEKRLHEFDFELETTSSSSFAANDYRIEVVAVVPSGETAYLLGEATYESSVSTYVDKVSFSGNITDKLTTGGTVGLNLDSSGLYGARSIYAYYYSHADDKTYAEISNFPSAIVTSGTPVDLYFDPFQWDDAGESLSVLTSDVEITRQSAAQIVGLKAKIGFISQGFTYSVKAKETNTSSAVTVGKLRHTLTTRKI